MTELELLHEAARTMRERASAATPGPWEHGGDDGLVWPPRIGDPVSGSTEPEDAEHIASWPPAVALAVADSLDYAYRTLSYLQTRGHRPAPNGWVKSCIAIARTYLGRAS